MVPKSSIDAFLAQRKLAVVGVSRDSKKFSNAAYRVLKDRGYTVYAVNPYAERVEGDRCYPAVKDLPEQVGGALVMLPPEKTEQVLPEIAKAGIKNVWIQQLSETAKAIEFCREQGINVVHGECIIMFAEPVAFPHRMHRWGKKLFGKLPA